MKYAEISKIKKVENSMILTMTYLNTKVVNSCQKHRKEGSIFNLHILYNN